VSASPNVEVGSPVFLVLGLSCSSVSPFGGDLQPVSFTELAIRVGSAILLLQFRLVSALMKFLHRD
jgi:hypothetical protein